MFGRSKAELEKLRAEKERLLKRVERQRKAFRHIHSVVKELNHRLLRRLCEKNKLLREQEEKIRILEDRIRQWRQFPPP